MKHLLFYHIEFRILGIRFLSSSIISGSIHPCVKYHSKNPTVNCYKINTSHFFLNFIFSMIFLCSSIKSRCFSSFMYCSSISDRLGNLIMLLMDIPLALGAGFEPARIINTALTLYYLFTV